MSVFLDVYPLALSRFSRLFTMVNLHRLALQAQVGAEKLVGEPKLTVVGGLCDPRKIAIDVGAADGVYSSILDACSLSCIAFEPNPCSFRLLEKRLPALRIENLALSNKPGQAKLRVPMVGGVPYAGYGTIEPCNKLAQFSDIPKEGFEVRATTLDSFDFDNIGFIKIDVEGHELEVLQGAEQTIRRNTPTLMVEIEERHRKGSVAEVSNFLVSLEFVMYYWGGESFFKANDANIQELQNADHVGKRGKYINNFFFLHKSGESRQPAGRDA